MTDNTNDKASIKEKLAKLLRLAEKAGTAEEAAAAAGKAAELALQYGIDLNSVDPDSNPKVNQEELEDPVDNWEISLASAVAKLNAARVIIWTRGGEHKIRFYGRNACAISARLMHEYLTSTVLRLNRQAALKRKGTTSAERRRFREAFRVGAMNTLCQRLHERYEQLRAEGMANSGGTGSALVVAGFFDQEAAALEDYMAKNHPNLRSGSFRTNVRDINGLAQGMAAAKGISLNRQTTGTSSNLKRIGG